MFEKFFKKEEKEIKESEFVFHLRDDGTYEIIGVSKELTSILNIPDTFLGIRVTRIGDEAFKDNNNIVEVNIPKGIVYMGKGAFQNTSRLRNVIIDDNSNLKVINDFAFHDASSLISISFGNNSSIRLIGSYAFARAIKLKSIIIPKSVMMIREWAFASTTDLESVVFENESKLNFIGDSAFEATFKLRNICIPEGVGYLPENTFYGSSACVTHK